MPPPFLVDADGNPYDADLQRLVPGRENLTDAQLIPHIITNENGVSEIIGDREDETPENEQNQRRRNRWIKSLIKPLESSMLRTSELDRNQSLDQEENNYKKELKEIELSHQKGSVYIYRDGENSMSNRENTSFKRRRGKSKKNTDLRESGGSTENTNNNIMDFEEETMDDPYIEIDDDSNTRHSDAMQASSNQATTSNNANSSRPNNRSRRTVYIEPSLQSDSDRSSEYSDWAEQDGRRTLKPPPRKTTRQRSNRRNRHKRVLRIEDDDDGNENSQRVESAEEDEEDIGRTRSNKSKMTISKKLKKIVSDDDDDEEEEKKDQLLQNNDEEMEEDESETESEDEDIYDEDYEENDENADPNKPCTSRAASSKSPRKKLRKSKKRGRPPQNSKLSDLSGHKIKTLTKQTSKSSKLIDIKECPPEYRPPEWLTSTKPKKTPYVPQIGDEVVYFRQGHELYVHAVRDNKLYEVEEKYLPWMQSSKNIDVQEFCTVVNIKIELKQIRLVSLKLGVIDRHGKSTGVKFVIKYHDMPGVADFVVLKQFYEKALERNWKPKDRFVYFKSL